MKSALLTFASAIVVLAGLAGSVHGATLEVPSNGGDASGIGYFSGWKCPPNGNVTIVLDGGAPISVPSGVRRLDTAGICGNTGFNGYISQFNFNLLGNGAHTVSVRQNGVPFAQATFNVTTFGGSFLSGAAGTYVLANFPQAGRTTTVEWSEGTQNFVIVGTTGGGSAQVRFRNELLCNGFGFTSTLNANGFTWVAFSGSTTGYLAVNRTSLGPFVESNSTVCGDVTYPFTFPLTPGRRYLLVQVLQGGNPFLGIADEGAALTADELAAQASDADAPPGEPSVVLPGVAAAGSGTFSAVSPAE